MDRNGKFREALYRLYSVDKIFILMDFLIVKISAPSFWATHLVIVEKRFSWLVGNFFKIMEKLGHLHNNQTYSYIN